MQHHMNTAHHTVGKLGAVSSVGLHPTILFDGVIEFLKLLRGQRRQRSVSEIRFDLIFNHRFVRIQRALANREDHIFIAVHNSTTGRGGSPEEKSKNFF